tara:strand:- start:65362 stop:65505 length:144 start_codon:yes stop_codon:yes gene_type:complete
LRAEEILKTFIRIFESRLIREEGFSQRAVDFSQIRTSSAFLSGGKTG